MIATTLNMHADTFEKITERALKLNKSRHAVIVILMKKIMRDHESIKHVISSVRYQPDNDQEKWRCFHIRFRPEEYEFFMDLRKLCKCSVSLLIALAVERYIHELKIKYNKNVDNYHDFNNYKLRKICSTGYIIWQIYWLKTKTQKKTIII